MQRAIPKGRGFVYAYDSQLYRQVKKVGRVRYLKCTIEHCDSSAKLDNGQNHDWGKCSVLNAADATSARSAACEVCLLAPRDGVVLVLYGHSRFCAQCADAVADMPNGCSLCRTPIDMIMRVYFWCVSGELS